MNYVNDNKSSTLCEPCYFEHDCTKCKEVRMPDREMKEYIVKIRYGMEIGYGQEIVRCKDCKHRNDDYPCELHTIDGSAHDDWFCADGVK